MKTLALILVLLLAAPLPAIADDAPPPTPLTPIVEARPDVDRELLEIRLVMTEELLSEERRYSEKLEEHAKATLDEAQRSNERTRALVVAVIALTLVSVAAGTWGAYERGVVDQYRTGESK